MSRLSTGTVRFVPKKLFFDRAGIERRIGAGTARVMKRTGAYIRKTARNSMKKAPSRRLASGKRRRRSLSTHGYFRETKSGQRKGEKRFVKGVHSPPKSPPYYREAGAFNLRTIFFFYEPRDKTLRVATKAGASTSKYSQNVPLLHEEGGSQRVTFRAGGYDDRGRPRYRTGSASYPKRPFMDPAGQKGLEYLELEIDGALD